MARPAPKKKATIKSPRTIPAPKPLEGRPAIVDEFGRIAMRLDQVKPLQTRYEMLRSQIIGWHLDDNPAASYIEDGTEFSVQLGPVAARRTITDLAKVVDKVGLQTFLEICTVSLEKLDTVLLPKDQKNLVSIDRNGPRTVKAVAKYTPAAA